MAVIKTLQDFVGSNGLTAFIESFILIFFVGAVVSAMIASFMPAPGPGAGNILQRFTWANNFTQASTIVAGLVLTAATGVLGTPANIKIATVYTQQSTPVQAQQQPSKPAQSTAQILRDPQRDAFKRICAWLYVVLGAACFFVWVIPTASNHDLVRSVGLITLGFGTSIISNLQLPAAQ